MDPLNLWRIGKGNDPRPDQGEIQLDYLAEGFIDKNILKELQACEYHVDRKGC